MLNARGSSKSCGYGQPGPSNQLLEHRRLPDDLSRPSDKSLSLQKPRGGNKIALQHLVATVLLRLGMQRAGNCWRHREEGGGRRRRGLLLALGRCEEPKCYSYILDLELDNVDRRINRTMTVTLGTEPKVCWNTEFFVPPQPSHGRAPGGGGMRERV
jgi:hypothetical protein